MRRILAFLSAAVVAVALFASPISGQGPTLLQSVRPLQQVADGELHNVCSTTSVKPHVWLTAAHCVSDGTEVPYYITGEKVEFLGYDAERDVVFLITKEATATPLPIATTAPKAGDKIWIAGNPYGFHYPILVTGIVSNPDLKEPGDDKAYMVIQAAGGPGFSGASVVNDAGEIVGIVQRGPGSYPSPLFFGATWEQVSFYAYLLE